MNGHWKYKNEILKLEPNYLEMNEELVNGSRRLAGEVLGACLLY
jgi:hypothetical protein